MMMQSLLAFEDKFSVLKDVTMLSMLVGIRRSVFI